MQITRSSRKILTSLAHQFDGSTLAYLSSNLQRLEIIAAGGDVDYEGATAVELIGPGESAGNYREIEIQGGEIVTARYR